ncbi:hypothetical protein F2P56_026914 [Juglans regia]|uniref:Transcription factor 25 n=2 Tax=Juglans regia TaxID=51240 RepID=A0A2I4FRV3_JUGRE|nr:transcription factor 25 [Juglans regia]KAF5451851.1 hypothetical protein F2P56_026914 [Juglans regia]
MSARLLKRVLKEQQQQQRLQQLPREEEEDEDEEEEEQLNGNRSESSSSGPPSSINPFHLLCDEDDPEQGDDSEVVDETLKLNITEQEPSLMESNVDMLVTSSHKSKKKKKKRGKGGSLSSADNVEKPLDMILETLSLEVEGKSSSNDGVPGKAKATNVKTGDKLVKQYVPSILRVDPKYLNAENELRRIFGSKVVKSFEKNSQAGSSRQIRGGRFGSHSHRKTVLVTPSDYWPRWDSSLSMEFLETKDGYHYFRYVHLPSYDQAQKSFEAAQAIHDLNSIASILLHHPYHIDSLITMAEYLKFVGEHQKSADATAKSLYALECAWHPMFTPLQGNCQLKFSHKTNKLLFTSLFTHMRNMDRRGCHRSALEVCKLLLSLDSDDPMGAIFCIDYLSLRAEEYAWLEQFSEDYKSDNSLWLFPNFSYSLAISRFYLEQQHFSKDNHADSSNSTSNDLMKQALMLHPSILKKLVAKAPLKDKVWIDIVKHSFFRSDQTGIPSLDHLINIYVERNYIIWRLPELQKLLKDAAKLVIETMETNESDANDWACVRKEAFPSEKNEYGHLLVSDFSDSVPSIPPENLQNFIGDPRMRGLAQDEDQVANQPGNGHAPRDVANRNALAVLFESMLPWVHYGDEDDGGAD